MTETNDLEEKEPLLPGGIGLTIPDVQALLAKENGLAIPKDDPALMYVTIMNAALTEQAKLQKVHQDALAKMMAEHTNNYVQDTTKGMQEILATLSKLTSEGLNEAAKDMVKFRMSMIYCTAINFIAALLVVGVFVVKGL